MDFDDWEVLSDDGFLDAKHEDGNKGFFSRELGFEFDPKGGNRIAVDVNYFICPSPSPPPPPPSSSSPPPHRRPTRYDDSRIPKGRSQIVPMPIQLEPKAGKNPTQELAKVKDIAQVPMVEINVLAPTVLDKIKDPNPVVVADQVFFKKMKENEFVDMKMDSPRSSSSSSSSSSSRGLKPQIEVGPIQFEDKEEVIDGKESEHMPSKMVVVEEEKGKKHTGGSEIGDEGRWVGGGLNIWRWRFTGIGGLCSLGVAAATICIFIFSGHQRQKQQDRNRKQLRIQIYTDDERIKEVVHHATRLNQALSAVRGVPLTRAHITFGGYYDGL